MRVSHDQTFSLPFSASTDTGLRNIIDKLAEFVARNGPEFESITKVKQQGNPKFSFLYGGEHYHYYQWRTEQASKRICITHRIHLFTLLLFIDIEIATQIYICFLVRCLF